MQAKTLSTGASEGGKAPEFRKPIGERMKLAREKVSLKQEDMARLVGVHPGTYGHYERGGRAADFDTMIILAECAGVSLDWLATGEEAVTGPLDVGVLREVVQGVLEAAPELQPETQARLIARLYSDRMKALDSGRKSDDNPIIASSNGDL